MNGDSIRPTDAKTKGPLVGGLILIVLGFGILLAQFTDSGGGPIVGGIGLAFLTAFFFAGHNYGFLIPGSIMTGLGVGIAAEEMGVVGEPVVIGLGLGFILIWVIDAFFAHVGPESGRWWPLIPGGILLTVGLMNTATVLSDYAEYVFPVALIIVGGIILGSALRNR